MLAKTARPSSIAATILAKIVVGQHHLGGFLGNVAAAQSHGDADIRPLQGRGVVDAVSSHGHDLVQLLQDIDHSEFVLGIDPGKEDLLLDFFFQRLIAHVSEHGAGDDLGLLGCDDAHLFGDRQGRQSVIPRDHDDPDTGAMAAGKGILDLGARGIVHGSQSDEDQVPFDLGSG